MLKISPIDVKSYGTDYRNRFSSDADIVRLTNVRIIIIIIIIKHRCISSKSGKQIFCVITR